MGRRAAGPGRAVAPRWLVARHVPVDRVLGIEIVAGQWVAGRAREALARIILGHRPRGRDFEETMRRREPDTLWTVWGRTCQ